MAAIAVPLGALLAFLMVRTDVPGRRYLEPLILIPIFVSAVVIAFGYVVAIGPVGIFSTLAKDVLGFVPWNLYSLLALIVIAGLTHVPHVYLYSAAALRGLSTDLEEAARVSGANPFRVAVNVSLPMILPAILFAGVLVFFLGFELFGLPLVLGDPQDLLVLSTYLFKLTNKLGVPSYQLMAVVVVAIIAITAPLVFMQRLLLRQAQGRFDVHEHVLVTRTGQALHQFFDLAALQCDFGQPRVQHGLARRSVARELLRLLGHQARFGRVVARILALPRELLLDVRQLLPQHAAQGQRAHRDRDERIHESARNDRRAGRIGGGRGDRILASREGRALRLGRLGTHPSDSRAAITSTMDGRDTQTTPKPASRAACAMRGCVAMARACDQSTSARLARRLTIACELLSNHALPSRAAAVASAI